jgi:hypothetical protein
MDSGEEIAGLNEGWNFLGAKWSEWLAGVAMFLVTGELFFKGQLNKGMPLMVLAFIGTTLFLARIRKSFPDEERGLRNYLMVKCGFVPPGVPAPADFQGHWSGCPIYELPKESPFVQAGLDKVFFEPNKSAEDVIVNS